MRQLTEIQKVILCVLVCTALAVPLGYFAAKSAFLYGSFKTCWAIHTGMIAVVTSFIGTVVIVEAEHVA